MAFVASYERINEEQSETEEKIDSDRETGA